MGPWDLGRYNLGTRDPFLEYEGGTLNCEIRTPQHPLKFAPNVSVIKSQTTTYHKKYDVPKIIDGRKKIEKVCYESVFRSPLVLLKM